MPIAVNNAIERQSRELIDTPPNRAREVREAYNETPKEEGILDKGKRVITGAIDGVLNYVDNAPPLVKGLLLAGGALATGWVFKKCFDGFKDVGNWLADKVVSGASETLKNTFSTILAGALTTYGLARFGPMIAEFLTGAVGLDDLSKAIKEGKLIEFLLSKGKGVLPAPIITALEAVNNPQKTAEDALHKGMEWMDEKLQFSQRKQEMMNQLQQMGITIPDWLQNLSAEDVSKTLGLNQFTEGTWKDYLGLSGFALLLWKFGQTKRLALTGAFYFLVVSNGNDGLVGKVLGFATKTFDETKNDLLKKAESVPVLGALLPDLLKEFSLDQNKQAFFNLMKDHPYMATGAITATWYLRGVALLLLKGLSTGIWETLKFGFKNPFLTTLIVGGVTIKRRDILQSIADIAFQDDAAEKEKFLVTGRNILGLGEEESIVETQLTDSLDSLLKQPKVLFEKFKNGQLEFSFLGTGEVLIRVGGFLNIPWQIFQLSLTQFNVVKKILFEDLGSEGVFVPLVGTATTGFIFASMASESVKASKIVWDSKTGGFNGVWKALKTMAPLTPEWMFVVKSSFLGIPGVEAVYKQMVSLKIPKAQALLVSLESEMQNGNIKRAFEMADDILRVLEIKEIHDFKAKLPGNTFLYEFYEKLETVQTRVSSVKSELLKQNPHLDGIKFHLQNTREALNEYHTSISKSITRLELILQGRVLEAIKFSSEKSTITEGAIQPATVSDYAKNLTKGKTPGEIQTRITELKMKPGLNSAERKELTVLEGFLTGKHSGVAENLLTGANDLEKTGRLENAALEIAHAEQGVNARIQTELDAVKKFAIDNNLKLDDPKIQEKLIKIDEELVQPFAKQKAQNIKRLNLLYSEVPQGLRTDRLKIAVKSAMYGREENPFVKVKQGAIGRVKLMGVMAAIMVGVDTAMNMDKIKEDPAHELAMILQNLGPKLVQLLIDILPGVGTYSNFHSAITGEQLYDKETDVSSKGDRIANALFGVAGAAADIATIFTLGAATPANIAARIGVVTAKMGSRGPKIAKALMETIPAFERIAEKMGGWKEFAKNFVEIINAQKTNIQQVQKYAMYGGMTAMAGNMAIGYFYTNTESIDTAEIHSDLREETSQKVSVATNDNFTLPEMAMTA